jgi:hypothetical protein
MAPTTETGSGPAKQTRRTVPRIIPAIPLALSRAPPSARPITPEDTVTETVTQHDAEPQTTEDIHAKEHAVEDPLTPKSKASVVDDAEAVLKTPVSAIDAIESVDVTGLFLPSCKLSFIS